MASAFTMLGMLRRTTAKRRGTTASQESTASTPATTSSALPSIDATLTASPSSSPPSTTTVPPPAPSSIATHSTESELDLSDSASIISASSITSKKAKKKRSPSMLLRGFSLSRKSSVGSGLSQSQATQPHVNTNVPAASILSPILASPIDAEGSGFTHEPEGIEGQGQGLARKVSSDGFSVVSHHDEEVQQPKVEKVDREEGDWTEVVESFPTPPPSVSTPPPAIATTGHDEEPNSLSFNDAEELTSAEEELKKASAKVKVLEGTLAEREVEKHRLEEEIRGVAAEKARLESMVHGIEARLKEVEDRGRDEQKEKERLGRELLRVRGENDSLSKSLHDQIDRLKALEDRYAQQEVEKSRLEASLASLLQDKDKLAAKARADAESLKETKARYARQELEKGGVKAELQSMSKEKEAAALKLYSVTQQLEDARRDYEDECAKVEHLEEEAKLLQDEKRRLEGKANQLGEEKKRVEGEAKRLEVELQNRTLEGEKSALEAKEASEELDHLYKRYAEQDDELNRLKEELHRTSAANKELVQASLDAARTATEINEKLVELEKTVREERQRVFDAHAAETRTLKGDLQAGTAIAEELLRTAREMKRENEGLNGRMKEMKRSFDEDRRRMLEDHENSVRRLGQEERQRAAEERRALVEDYEGRMRQLKEGWEEAVAKTGRELVETRTRLVEEHAAEVERLKEANWDLEALTTTMAEDHKVAKKKWEDEKKALKTEWDNERSAWAKEREQASKVHNELNRLLESEKADHREFKSSVDKTFEEMRARTSNELAKSNEALRRKREQVSELDSRLQRVRKEVNDLKVWQAKAAEAAGEAARLRKAVQKMAGQTDSAVFEDQARRQASADIRFSRPSTSHRGSGSADAIEPVDAALSVLYALNSEIFQAAASLADTIEGSPPPAGLIDTVNDFGALMEKVAPFLSEELVVSLRSAYSESSDGPNPLILQVAFQACLAYSCNRFITSWYPIHWEYGRFLEVMHGRLIDAGAIPEADSFRSTTRALLRLTSESHPKMVSYLRNSVLDILSIIGRPSSGPATETMLELFEEKFAVISRLAIRLHILFNDTPSNLETFLAKPMAQFMEDRMEDTYGDEDDLYSTDAANLKNVICTSEIGLQRVAVRNGADESVIMKPKVILAAILNQEW